jgi:hypothetical protein
MTAFSGSRSQRTNSWKFHANSNKIIQLQALQENVKNTKYSHLVKNFLQPIGWRVDN